MLLYTTKVEQATATERPRRDVTLGSAEGRHAMMMMLAVLSLAIAEPPVAEAPAEDAASSLAGLQQVYDQSCAAREYGAYDDLCDQLAQQLKAARVEADRDARRKTAEARRHPRPQPDPPGPPALPAPAKASPPPSRPSATPG